MGRLAKFRQVIITFGTDKVIRKTGVKRPLYRQLTREQPLGKAGDYREGKILETNFFLPLRHA